MEDFFLECFIDTLYDFLRMDSIGIHRYEHTIDLQVGIDPAAYFLYRLHQQGYPAQCKELGSHGDNNTICCGQGIDCKQPQRRLAVNDDRVVFILQFPQSPRQHLFTSDFSHQLHFGSRQVNIGRDNIEVRETGTDYYIVDIHIRIKQCRIYCIFNLVRVDPQSDRCRPLRIEIYNKDFAPILAKCARYINRAGRFTYSAFLIAHSHDPCRPVLFQAVRRGKSVVVASKHIYRHTVTVPITLVFCFHCLFT